MVLAVLAGCSPAPGLPPNILVIVADDLGVGDLGTYGSTDVRTPHIDGLAASGVRFSRFYAAGDSCAPTRASLLTGLYPQRLGFRGRYPIPPEVVTLPELLSKAGYATHHIGKWHFGTEPESLRPLSQGFGSFFGFLDPSELDSYRNPALASDAGAPVEHVGHLTDLLTDRAVERIVEGAQGAPWFVNVWYFAPHTRPKGRELAPERWAQQYPSDARGRHRALVSTLDEGVGRLLRAVERTGQAERTTVLFLSDNGAIDPLSNRPFFGTKSQMFEGGLRVPLVIRIPGVAPAVFDAVASSLDIYPTLAALAGAGLEGEVDGIDLTPLLRGSVSGTPSRRLFWENADFAGPWARRIVPTPAEAAPADLAPGRDFSVLERDGRWRLSVEMHGIALFDLAADPTGRRNVYADHPDVTERLVEAYRGWAEEVGKAESR